MLSLLLQSWGATFFLLNKVFLSVTERSQNQIRKKWLVLSWVVYLIGLPAWVIIFISQNNWIAAFVEAGAAPAMIVGLYAALNDQRSIPSWLNLLSAASVLCGLGLSLYKFRGISSFTQLLELGVAAGFLIGTYYLAKGKAKKGYFWLMEGNMSCAVLVGIEGFFLLMLQQIISLGFVIDAYLINRKIVSYSKQISLR